jgi:hypothetical protein
MFTVLKRGQNAVRDNPVKPQAGNSSSHGAPGRVWE